MDSIKTTAVRRPLALWILVGLYSALVLGQFGLLVYMRFWGSLRSSLAAKYADWTILDFAATYYPSVLLLIGCVGLVMLRRWALCAFGILLILRLREVALLFFRDDVPEEQVFIFWLPRLIAVVIAAIPTLYALHLVRSGTVKETGPRSLSGDSSGPTTSQERSD